MSIVSFSCFHPNRAINVLGAGYDNSCLNNLISTNIFIIKNVHIDKYFCKVHSILL